MVLYCCAYGCKQTWIKGGGVTFHSISDLIQLYSFGFGPTSEEFVLASFTTPLNSKEDKKGYEAILNLHQYLDDDEDGNIDIDESKEFYREELNYKSGYDRQKRFHRNDKHISVDELWRSWKASEVHNWTVEETIQWLISYVNLPQYAETFKENSIDGSSLPRLAVSSNFLLRLGIKDPIHKHKITLKAMDVVLFGPPRSYSFFKDISLALSLGLATGGCYFAYFQHKKSQSHLQKTMKDMESLQRAENSLRDLQKALDKAKLEQEIVVTEKKNLERRLQDEKISAKLKHEDSVVSSDGGQSKTQRLEEELRDVIDDLRSAERALKAKNWLPSPKLQLWLQLTHELELQSYNEKKASAEKQLLAAKEGCDKLRKKRTSFMGAFRVAHGNAIDDVDNRILKARTALSEVTKDLQERLSRWKEIEGLCGFPVVHNHGIRQIETMLGSSVAGSPTTATPRVPRRSSEGTFTDEDSVSGMDSSISAIQHLVHNSATLFLAPLPSSNFSNLPSFDNGPPRSSLYQDDSFSFYSPGFISFPQNDQSITNGSIASIPALCSQRSGIHYNLGTGRSIQLADLKSVASSSAILQRSNAYYVDGYENILEEKVDRNASASRAMPMFTVGESHELPNESTLLDNHRELPKTY